MTGKRTLSWKKRLHHWIQRNIIPPLAATVGQWLLFVLTFTYRYQIRGVENFCTAADRGGCLLMLWHDRLTIALPTLFRIPAVHRFYFAAVVSKSRDGAILSAIARTYRQGTTIRVAHNARHRAVTDMVRYLNNRTVLLITPDGPKGPAHRAKPGVVRAAQETGTPVIPFTWSADRCWLLPTWDKMKLPKPFAKVTVQFGEPVTVSADESPESCSARLEAAMAEAAMGCTR